MRWVAVVGWLGAVAFVLSQLLSNPKPALPVDLAPTGLCVAVAALIAVGGRIGRIGALIGTGVAAFATVAGLVFAVWQGAWLIALGALALTVVTYMAARQAGETSPA